MGKIPVGRTIVQSYGFAFGHYFGLLAVLWLPMLVISAVDYYVLLPLFRGIFAGGDPAQAFIQHPAMLQSIFLLDLAGLLVLVMISTGITKEALGVRGGPRFVYLAFGAAEFRVLGGFVAILLLSIVFAIALGIVNAVVGVGLGVAVHNSQPGILAAVLGLAFIIEQLAMFYFFLRLTFLFLPVTVAERRVGILRSWELSAGNFWRIFLIGLAVIGPLMLVIFVCEFFVMWPVLAHLAAHPQPADQQAVFREIMRGFGQYFPYLPYVFGVFFLVSPILYGLFLGPAAFAYLALVPPPATAAVPVFNPPPPPPSPASDLPKEIAEIVDEPPPR